MGLRVREQASPSTPASGYSELYPKSDGLWYFKDDTGAENLVAFGNYAFKNRLINPDGGVYQRTVAAAADDVYFADRWYALTQTGTVTPSVLANPEDGYPHGVRVTQSQASAQRFGFAQIIEGVHCKDLRAQSGVLTPRIRISNSQAVRYAILGWTGTEDAVTSDVVNDWTNGTYTAGNFFLGTNVSVLAVGSATPGANSWTSLAALSAALGSAFNNIIVMVWTEGTAAQNVTMDFDYIQFEKGAFASEFERLSYTSQWQQCSRYYLGQMQYDNYDSTASSGRSTSCILPTEMRAAPTVTVSATAGSATGSGYIRSVQLGGTGDGVGNWTGSFVCSAEL